MIILQITDKINVNMNANEQWVETKTRTNVKYIVVPAALQGMHRGIMLQRLFDSVF